MKRTKLINELLILSFISIDLLNKNQGITKYDSSFLVMYFNFGSYSK